MRGTKPSNHLNHGIMLNYGATATSLNDRSNRTPTLAKEGLRRAVVGKSMGTLGYFIIGIYFNSTRHCGFQIMLRKRLDECLSQHLQIASLSRQAKLFPWRLPFPSGETYREYSMQSRHWTLLECAPENIAEWESEKAKAE